jgi:hypothetical protein
MPRTHHLSGMEREKHLEIVKNCETKTDSVRDRVCFPFYAHYCGGCGFVACGIGCATEGKILRGVM